MGTQEKLKVMKEILSTSFIRATEQSISLGLQFKYKSYGVDLENQLDEDGLPSKGWVIDILVKEAGYGERTIQQLKFLHPKNIDAKRMELHALLEFQSSLVQGAVSTWYEVAKMLATDADLQKQIIDGAKEDNIPSY